MINPETRAQIRRYFFAEHWKVGTIAQALNVHPDTVWRAIEVERFQHAKPLRPSIVDPAPAEVLVSGNSRRFRDFRCVHNTRGGKVRHPYHHAQAVHLFKHGHTERRQAVRRKQGA